MPSKPSPALGVSRTVLRILIKLNWLMGFGILALLVASLIAPEPVMHALGVGSIAENPALGIGTRLIMVVGIISVFVSYTVLARLLAIVDTVSDGDAFVLENAVRMRKIAWAIVALEALHLVVFVTATTVSTPATPLDIGSNFSVARWLAVLLLFVLAQVFEQGVRMREDLEGTV